MRYSGRLFLYTGRQEEGIHVHVHTVYWVCSCLVMTWQAPRYLTGVQPPQLGHEAEPPGQVLAVRLLPPGPRQVGQKRPCRNDTTVNLSRSKVPVPVQKSRKVNIKQNIFIHIF